MSDLTRTRATIDALAVHKRLDPAFLRERFVLHNARQGVEVPYYSLDGSLSRSRLRRYTETAHPTQWLAGQGALPYFDRANREAARNLGWLVIVEGETDVWALAAHDMPALGVPGATMAKVIAREDVASIPQLLVIREPDAAGARFVRDICDQLRELAYSGAILVIDLQATCGVKDPSALHVRNPKAFEVEWDRAVAAAIEVEKAAAPCAAAAKDLPAESVEGAVLLDELAATYRRFVEISQEQADTLALYVLHSHAVDGADVTPYILLRSPEKRCGKTLTLRISQHLCRNVVLAANVTAAALFRLIDAEQPTYMIDEVDTIYGGHKSERNEDIRAILNAGFERGASIPRCVGKDRDVVKRFNPFCAKMLAGVRCRLPDTLLDRCIVFEMKRKSPGTKINRFHRQRNVTELHVLRDRASTWATQNVDALKTAEHEPPGELNARAQDVWEPLFQIADRVGGEWPKRALCAALTLSGEEAVEDESRGVRLLSDIREFFDAACKDRVSSAQLVKHLAALEESPWGHLDARTVASMLKVYGISPKTIRLDDGTTPKGYLSASFVEAFSLYLPTRRQAPQAPRAQQGRELKPFGADGPAANPPQDGNAESEHAGEHGGHASATRSQPRGGDQREIKGVASVADVALQRNRAEAAGLFDYAREVGLLDDTEFID